MARAFWKGSVSFGLVEIPVALRPAIRTHDLDFTLLDRKDFSPVGNRRYNKSTGKEVPWDRVVRGYEYEKDEYVALSDEELRQANVKATQTIEILEFVDQAEIDPVYFDTPYYVEPQKKASKSYVLLRSTLEKTGRAGIARVVLRTRQHLAALLVRDGVLVLELLHWASEVVPAEEVETPAGAKRAGVSERELGMAAKLVEGMHGTWNPERYRDEYREDVLALVKRKVKSGEVHTIVEAEPGAEKRAARAEVMDLMPLLKQSLEQQHGAKRNGRAPSPRSSVAAKPPRRSPARVSSRAAGARTRKRSA